ncbi:CARDB domain-containing protein [Methanoculleus sp. UBA303]|uniref:CARDB domain-containing protein n=1 Tax=Methanoculleus sp. UBA303 TaxID=1915497 RepID=UPI0025E73E94|nr:CARDB domain-containing protein [Methanoculleus sp. UBA303]
MRDKRTTKLLIAVFLIVGLVPIVGALETTPTTIVAASDSSAADKAAAAYVCDGVNDHVEIQAALNALPSSGGVVLLTSGTYNCAGIIAPKAGSTLKGEGESETFLKFTRDGRINVDREYITLDGFHVQGSGYSSGVKWLGVMTIRASHAKLHNITGTADASIQAVYLLVHDPTVYAPTLQGIEFINCRAVDTGTYGFLHNAWGTTNKVIKDVRYENCAAINCGKYGAFNPWITGFDFAELNDMDGLRVKNCLAEGTLESGFHFEFDPKVTNAVLENCVSRNNGQKAFPARAYNPNDMSTHYFGCGYYAPNADVTFINCTAEGNSMNGFYTTNGGKLYNCVEKDTGIGRTDFSYRVPAGYYSVPTRSVNPSTVMENCTSITSRAYGLQVDLANNVKIRNFHLIDPVGYKGKGSSLGGTNGQFDNSEVSIYASGNRVETLVWAKENVNTVFSGQIVSDAAKPFVVEGYRTKNVLVKDMEIVSSTLPAGSAGVTIVGTVPAGQATLQNVKVVSTGSPVPTPTVPAPVPTPTTPAPSGKPDLVVTDISWDPASPAPGSAVTLRATIKNQGDAPTPAGVRHGVLFTFDDGAAGPGVWSDTHTASIAPGAWVTLTANGGSTGATWKAIEGTHTVKANVDDLNRIAESDEANNVKSEQITVSKAVSTPAPTPTPTPTTPAPSGKPDLVVTDISWDPATPAPGSAVTLRATIKNQGTAPTPAGVKHGVLFTFDDGAAGPGVWSDTHTAAIAAGASVTLTASGGSAGATWKAIEGTHTVKANVDDVNRIAESDENNNVMSKEIVVGTRPAPVRGDLNGDGSVDWADVTIVAEMAQGTTKSNAVADFDGNGTVDWKDVALLADFFFGRTSSL